MGRNTKTIHLQWPRSYTVLLEDKPFPMTQPKLCQYRNADWVLTFLPAVLFSDCSSILSNPPSHLPFS